MKREHLIWLYILVYDHDVYIVSSVVSLYNEQDYGLF